MRLPGRSTSVRSLISCKYFNNEKLYSEFILSDMNTLYKHYTHKLISNFQASMSMCLFFGSIFYWPPKGKKNITLPSASRDSIAMGNKKRPNSFPINSDIAWFGLVITGSISVSCGYLLVLVLYSINRRYSLIWIGFMITGSISVSCGYHLFSLLYSSGSFYSHALRSPYMLSMKQQYHGSI